MNRKIITQKTLQMFMESVGRVLRKNTTLYLTGGSTALLYGFRESTIDIDIAGDMDEMFAHIPGLKEKLQINIEMAKPTDFVPSLPGENTRHIFIDQFGKVIFMHFDPYSQAFSKIVRGNQTDMSDVKNLAKERLVDLQKLSEMVKGLSDIDFARYPRLDRRSVEQAVNSVAKGF
jgi:hypothetical protein